jgi:hypothetical protein
MARSAPSWSLLAVVAAGIAYVLGFHFQMYPDTSFLTCFSIIYGILGLIRLTWMVVIWPRLFSPLCYLPHPPVRCSYEALERLNSRQMLSFG